MMKSAERVFHKYQFTLLGFALISGHKIVGVVVDVGGSLATISPSSVRKQERKKRKMFLYNLYL